MTSDITAVVSCHDPGPAIEVLVEALLDGGQCRRVHLVDSGSSDGAVEAAKARWPEIEVTLLGENRGPCATRNRGMAAAETPLVLLLDDDMRWAPDCVPRLQAELDADPGCVMAGPRIHAEGDGDVVQYEGGMWHYAGLTHMRGQMGETLAEVPTEVDVLTSGCLLLRRDAVVDAGGFDEDLFYLMEDAELSLRLRYLGYRLVVVPAARAWNRGASAGLSLEDSGHPAERVRLHARNRCLLLLGLYDGWTLCVLAPGILLLDAAWAGFALLGGRGGAFLRGRLEALRLLGSLRRKRRSFIPRKLVRDRELCGAPPLSLTPVARGRGSARLGYRVLDGTLRMLWIILRGALR